MLRLLRENVALWHSVFQSKVIQNVHHNVRSAREVEVTWSVSDPSLLDSLYITYSYQVIQVGDCLVVQQDKGKGYVVELKGSRSRLMLHNLEPWHTYHFNLRAASPSLPEEEEVTEGTFATSSARESALSCLSSRFIKSQMTGTRASRQVAQHVSET